MAIRAKLSPPRDEQSDSRWHQARWTTIRANVLGEGDRRMEADNYLSGGYGIRLAFHSQRIAPHALSQIAAVWQPSRLKGIQLDKDFGTPFLASTQVFDLRPAPRKFLSLDRTDNSTGRFVGDGTIVVTCSGSVGRSTLVYAAHQGVLISHDLLRVEPIIPEHWGWLYAFFRSDQARAMMTSAQYGHMIKHLEPSHLLALPMPVPRNTILARFNEDASSVLTWRNEAWALQQQAEALFEATVGKPKRAKALAESGFTVRAADLLGGRRRLEATFHSPVATALLEQFHRRKFKLDRLADVSEGVWWLTRFKRVFGDEGDRYLSADELFSINPTITKRVLAEQVENPANYRVKAGWIVMACSGQTYGLNGSVALMTKRHEDAFFSHDLIRIIPKLSDIRPGYLFAVLGHPTLGRPLVIRTAYGTSIPHLDPDDVGNIPVVRLDRSIEGRIADMMEQAIELRVKADDLENALADRATELNEFFLSGDTSRFAVTFSRNSAA